MKNKKKMELVNLLCSADICSIVYEDVESLEAEVKIMSLAIKSPGRADIVLAIPENGKPHGLWFTLKEGSKYRLQFTFQVSNNIVSGLKYTNTVWKTGVKGNFFSFSLSFLMKGSAPFFKPFNILCFECL